MTTKEYLQQYRDAVRDYNAAVEHKEELRAVAERITPNYGGEGGGTHQSGDKLGAVVGLIVDAESRVNDELRRLVETEREVNDTIQNVRDGTLRALLYERYIIDKTWEQIAVSLNYTYRRVTQLHGKALNAVGQICAELAFYFYVNSRYAA